MGLKKKKCKINKLACPNRKGQVEVHRNTTKTPVSPRLQVKPEETLATTTQTGWSLLCKQQDMATGNSEGGSGSMTSAGKENNVRELGRLLPPATVSVALWQRVPMKRLCDLLWVSLTGQRPLTSGLGLFILHSCQDNIVNTLLSLGNLSLIIFSITC